MKIVYIAPSIIPSRSANSVHVCKVLQAMNELGHMAKLVVPRKKKEIEKGITDLYKYYGVKPFKIKYFPWVKFSGSVYLYGCFMAVWLRFQKMDLVYSRDFYPALFCALLGIKTVYEFHSPPRFFNGIKGKAVRKFYKSPNLVSVVVISDALKKICIEAGFQENKIIVAHDGSDPLRQDISLINFPAPINIGYIGHLYKGRGIDLILEVAKEIPDATFHIIGGHEEDIAFWKAQNTTENVVFHGFQPPARTENFRASMDILLAPYQRVVQNIDGIQDQSGYMSPLKIFEYMTTGKAIVSSNLPVLQEVLHERNAILCDPERKEEWITALRTLINDETLRKELGRQAQRDFLEKYTWEKRTKYILTCVQRNRITETKR